MEEQTISVTVEMKVNLGNYESAGAAITLNGLRYDTTEDEIGQMLDTGKLAWSLMTARLKDKAKEMRSGR